jgi:hypothetical protein
MARIAVNIVTAKPANTTFTNTEKVIGTITGVTTASTNQVVTIEAALQLITAAGSTKATFRVRRETLTGHECVKMVEKAGASAERPVGVQCVDEPGEIGPMSYVLTAEEAAAETDTAHEISIIAQT